MSYEKREMVEIVCQRVLARPPAISVNVVEGKALKNEEIKSTLTLLFLRRE